MIIGVLKEAFPETRVSLTPEVTQALTKMGVNVWIARGAGDTAFYPDAQYEAVGGKIVEASALADADILLSIHAENVPAQLKQNAVIMGVFQ
ncbi:MAG: NAD(P)(+) transhydrogenase (Re/Si-specific) subunit alpha, partial [Chitinophagaceae bacterium]